MNTIVQNILTFGAVILAVGFLIKKFFWKKKENKSCGTNDCGCH